MKRFLLSLAGLILCFAGESSAAAPLVLTGGDEIVRPGPALEILADPSARLALRDILADPDRHVFRPASAERPNFGFVTAAYWTRLRLVNRGANEAYMLQFDYPPMDDLRLFQRKALTRGASRTAAPASPEDTAFGAPGWLRRQGGDLLPFDRREIKHRTLIFPVRIPPGEERVLFLRFQTAGAMVIAPQVLTPEAFRAHDHEEQMAFGLYYGILGVLCLYNAVLFFLVRDRSYLYYFLYIGGYGAVQLNLNGLAYEYLWPDWPWWNNVALNFAIGWTFFWGLMFSRKFLNSREQTPRLDRLLLLLLPAMVGLMGSALLLPYHFNINLSSLLVIVFSLSVFATAFVSWRTGYRPARYFLIAWASFLIAVVVYALKGQGILPSNYVTEYGLQLGSALEMALLSLGLADRIALINSEKEAARRQAMEVERLRHLAELRGARLEIELLKKHIQPHFLLNSINSSIAWLEEDPPTAVRLLQALGEELRQLLDVMDRPLIPIAQEIEICRAHLDLMSLRQDKKFSMTVAGEYDGIELPPLVLHTLIENGLTHGFSGREGGRFELRLEPGADGEPLRLRLANDGKSSTAKDGQGTGTGLKYVRSRLEESFPGRWRLDQGPGAVGWEATIEITAIPANGSAREKR